ncbi:MAG: SDR family oxidoreductase [Bacteroidetes bacterium]|nr:SDR family oxidoreductase [Bacteroidota bacterium]HET6244766.1 SDR family oxidoreductase [Bacteroidia bacterium]
MIAVISGATRGIGRALSFAFAAEGFSLALTARSESELNALSIALRLKHPSIEVMVQKADFSNKEEIKKFTSAVIEKWKESTVIINNVGIYSMGSLSEETDEAFEKNMAVNFSSAWYFTRPFLPALKLKGKGHIFNICSVVSKEPKAGAASYSISKVALYGFNKVLCEEMREYNVKVTAVLPGSVNTSSWKGLNAPVESFVEPEDVSSAIVAAYKTSAFALTEEIIIRPLDRKY